MQRSLHKLLEATQNQMRKAYLRNSKAASALQGSHEPSKALLLFYSVECGLKHLIMRARSLKTTKDIATEFGHNLHAMVAELNIARSEMRQEGSGKVIVPIVRRQGRPDTIGISDFHTAMRYAIDVEAADQAGVSDFLRALENIINRRMAGE